MKRIVAVTILSVCALSSRAGITASSQPPELSPPYVQDTDCFDVVFDHSPLIDVVGEFTRAVDNVAITVTPADLKGTATVNLHHVPWRPALESILDQHGLVLEEPVSNSGVFRVVVRRPDHAEPCVHDPTFADGVSSRIPIVLGLSLLALLLLNPLLAVATFRCANRISPQARPFGGPALWTYAVLVGGLPAFVIFWWVHKEAKGTDTAKPSDCTR